jgi:hypothetical protein
MNQARIWSIDETRRPHVEVIAKNLGLTTFSQVMNLAIDEFIARHSEVKPLRPEPPKESKKDRSIRKRIEEWAANLRTTPHLVRHDILIKSADELLKKYNLHPSALLDYREYIQRTDREAGVPGP